MCVSRSRRRACEQRPNGSRRPASSVGKIVVRQANHKYVAVTAERADQAGAAEASPLA